MSDASLSHCTTCGRVEYDCACHGREPTMDQLLDEALRKGEPSWPPLLGAPQRQRPMFVQ